MAHEERKLKIAEALVEAGIERPEAYKRALLMLEYMDAILEKNQHINLTRIVEPDEFVEKHLLDSLEVLLLDEYEQAQRILDVGTGAGFPGIMLAIASPNKEFVLLDARRKKLKVIEEIVAKLDIDNVVTIHGRAEELQKNNTLSRGFDLVVSRAVADMERLLGWTIPFVRSGGLAVYYKGPGLDEELKSACKELKRWHVAETRTCESHFTRQDHVLLVMRRNCE